MLRNGIGGRHLLILGCVLGLVSWVVWQVQRQQGAIVPGPGWTSITLLVVIAGLVVSVAWPIRAHRRGTPGRPLNPLRAARAVAVAQAGALTGAGALGWYAGQLLAALPDVGLRAGRAGVTQLGVAVVASAVALAAGLWAQNIGRVDPPDDI